MHESLAFDFAEPAVSDGIPITGVARTILDCAPMFEKPIQLLDDALRQRIVTWDELPPGGEFARRMAEMLTGAGLPMPVFEHPVLIDGHRYYLDLAWPSRMVAVECNDAGSHDTPKAFRRDPMKRNRCERVGWTYLEFTWWDLVDSAAEVLALVAAALVDRAA